MGGSRFSFKGEFVVSCLTVAVEPVQKDSEVSPTTTTTTGSSGSGGCGVGCQTVSRSVLVYLEQVKGVGII